MIFLLWIWMLTGSVAAITAMLAVLRMRAWWANKTTRSLVVFFVGVAIHASISVYLSGSALGGPRAQIDRAFGDPALWGVKLLTFGQLCMLVPAILLAAQMLGIFETPPAKDKDDGPPHI